MNILHGLRWYYPIAIVITTCCMSGPAQGAEDSADLAFVQKIVAAINRNDKEARKSLMHPDVLFCDQALEQALAKAPCEPKQSKIPPGYRWKINPMPAGNEDMAVAKGVVEQLMQEREARIGK